MTVTMNIHEAKTHLSRLIEQVLNGERVVIAKAGRPVVDLIVHQPVTVTYGGFEGQFHYTDDDFEGSDPEIDEMFYGAHDESDDHAPA